MTVKIDKAGRIVVPKPVRDRLGLREGSQLELEEIPAGIVLKAVEGEPAMIKKHGLWVHTGKPPEGFDWERHFENVREDYLRKISGL
jgi:AbrB family looped-hinge helix DNA binding protein